MGKGMVKKKMMIYRHEIPVWVNQTATSKKWGWLDKKIEEWQVEVMAEVGKYAMVRRKGCMPFVVSTKDLVEAPCSLP